MENVKAYFRSVGSAVVTFGVIYLLLNAITKDPVAMYFCWVAAFCGLAGPLKIYIDNFEKKRETNEKVGTPTASGN